MFQSLYDLMISVIFTIVASMIFGIATPLFKKATYTVGEIHPREFKKDFKNNLKKLLNKYMVIAAILQITGWLIFLMSISRYEVSIVTPILSMTYIFTAVYSNKLLNEKLNIKEIIGILVIILGVIVLTFPFT
ncbi:MAG: EamA family transporter [Candidatus Odinarchaeia archaeon]